MGSGRESLEPLRVAASARLARAAAALDKALPDTGPPKLAACACPVCLHPDNRRELETNPRARVSLNALRDYLQAVEASDLSDPEADYFVPLIFRALAAGLEPHPFGDHLAFNRIGGTDRPSRWSEAIREVVSEALSALMAAAPLRAWLDAPQFDEKTSRFHGIDIGSAASAADHVGADLVAVMAEADRLPDSVLARALITWIGQIDYGDGGRWKLDPRRSADTPLSATLLDWVGRPELRARLERAYFAAEAEKDEDKDAAKELSEAHWLLVCQFGETDNADESSEP